MGLGGKSPIARSRNNYYRSRKLMGKKNKARMWSDLSQMVDDLWSGSRSSLCDKCGWTRPRFYRLLSGGHNEEPSDMIVALHRQMQPRANRFGIKLELDDVLHTWKKSRKGV